MTAVASAELLVSAGRASGCNHDIKRCLVLMSWISETDIGGRGGGGGGGLPARTAAVRAASLRCFAREFWMSRASSLVAIVLPLRATDSLGDMLMKHVFNFLRYLMIKVARFVNSFHLPLKVEVSEHLLSMVSMSNVDFALAVSAALGED